jgi:hypothetical protein
MRNNVVKEYRKNNTVKEWTAAPYFMGKLLGHFSKPELAAELGVGSGTVYSWLSGKNCPSGRNMKKIGELMAIRKIR